MEFLKKFVTNSRVIHNFVSLYINLIPDFISHNISKYKVIKNCLLNVNHDQIKGDYCEFGCFTGAALNHAIFTHKKFSKLKKSNNFLDRKFYGFDSFEGFPEEVHNEFKSENFISNYEFVKKLEEKYENCKIIKGFFSNTLLEEKNKDLKKIAIAFIDCDIYKSAKPVIDFISDKMPNGSYIIIDDCFNIDENGNSIYKALTENQKLHSKLIRISNYGLNGATFKYLDYE